jgi:hypothetical protein
MGLFDSKLFSAIAGIPTLSSIKENGISAFVDPIGSEYPDKRPYTDPLNLLYKRPATQFKRGGKVVKKFSSGGKVGRGDGCASRGKTKGRVV